MTFNLTIPFLTAHAKKQSGLAQIRYVLEDVKWKEVYLPLLMIINSTILETVTSWPSTYVIA
jgi:hypothetical protein